MKTRLLTAIFRFSLCLLLLGFCPARGQEYRYLLDADLSSKQIVDIVQDSEGYIWIATENGLNRYDGNKIRIYQHSNTEPGSIIHSNVHCMFEDRDGRLFLSSYLGIQLYDRTTDSFSKGAAFRNGLPFVETSKGLYQFPDGTICSYGESARRISIEDGTLYVDDIRWNIMSHNVSMMVADSAGYTWVLRKDDGLYRLRSTTDSARLICPYINDQFQIYDIRSTGGDIYVISTGNDVYRFSPHFGRFEKVNASFISHSPVRDLIRTGLHELMVLTDGNGLKKIDETTGKVSDVDLNIPNLASNKLKTHCAIHDSQGNLWIGLYQKGIVLLVSETPRFGYIGYRSLSANLIGSSTPSAMTNDANGNLWIGTDGDGIYRLDRRLQTSTHLTAFTDDGSVPTIVKALFTDSRGQIWVGSYGDGCGIINPADNHYSTLNHMMKYEGKTVTRFYGFAEDAEGRIWAGSLGYGLFCYDLETKSLVKELSFYHGINVWVSCLLYSSTRDKLYVGTYDGLYVIDLKEKKPTPRQLTQREIIYSLFEDGSGNVWAGENESLISIDHNDEVAYISEGQHLPPLRINSIAQGHDKSLWLATDQGLLNYSPSMQHNYIYTAKDGLVNTQFSQVPSLTDSQGRIWMAGDYGVTYFSPRDITQSKPELHPRVVDIYLNGQPVTGATLSGGKPVCNGRVSTCQTFELDYADNSFDVEFGTTEYGHPSTIRYEFSLDNGDWLTLPPRGTTASIFELPAGTHSLRYRLNAETAQSATNEIVIVVRSPWWMSGIAIAAYLVLIAIIVLLLILRRRMLMQPPAKEFIYLTEGQLDKINLDDPDRKLMERIMRVVNDNISNPDLNIDMICNEAGISRAHFYRKLKELTNQSGREFVRNVRLQHAERLLANSHSTVNEIATALGFSSASRFAAAFKETHGVSPLQWRDQKQSQETQQNA